MIATYNGFPWIAEQIESVLEQSYHDCVVFVSDDTSSDDTRELLQQYQADKRLIILPPRTGVSGHVGNFEYLLHAAKSSGAEYIFLADQDDIWSREKVSFQVNRLQLVMAHYSDVELIDASGNSQGSYLSKMGLSGAAELKSLLAQNSVVGCSLAMRKELLELALPFPTGLQNHDWWLAICASALGGLDYDSSSFVKYRQHGNNAIGALDIKSQAPKFFQILKRQAKNVESKISAVEMLISRLEQSGAVIPEELTRYRDNFSGKNKFTIARNIIVGDFKPRSTMLALTQSLAVLAS